MRWKTAARFRGCARVAQRRGPRLSHDDQVAAGQLFTDVDGSRGHDGRDLAAECGTCLLRSGQLGVDASLPHDRIPAQPEEREDVLADHPKSPDSAGRADVVTVAPLAAERLRALVADLDVSQPEERAHILEEAGLLAHGFDQSDADLWQRDAQRETGKARAAADIDDALAAGPAADGESGEGIKEMLARDVLRLRDRCEVHGRIAFDELAREPLANGDLLG